MGKQGKNSGICLIDGCNKLAHARGYCAKHYRLIKQYGEEEGKKHIAEKEAIDKKKEEIKNIILEKQKKLKEDSQIAHEVQSETDKNNKIELNNHICKVDGCNKKVLAKGYCSSHYQIIHKYGEELGLEIIKEKNKLQETAHLTKEQNNHLKEDQAMMNHEHTEENALEENHFGNEKYAKNKGKTCKIDGCNDAAAVKGYCLKHYNMVRKYGEEEALARIEDILSNKTEDNLCKVEGCCNPIVSKGYCNKHYQQMRSKGYTLPVKDKTCIIDGCNKKYYAKGLCINHYSKFKRHPEIETVEQFKEICDAMPKEYTPEIAHISHDKCKVQGCDHEIFMNGYCKEHFAEHYNSILSYVFKMQLGNLFVTLDDFENLPEAHMILSKLKEAEEKEEETLEVSNH